MTLDPITIEVVLSRIRETTEAMAHALFHSGYSPILRESQDGTAGLTDVNGRVIMVGGGIQYHSLLYTKSVESLLQLSNLLESAREEVLSRRLHHFRIYYTCTFRFSN